MKNNSQLHSVIKLRHLKTASDNNWEMLTNTQTMVNKIIDEATQIMNTNGSETGKTQFNKDSSSLSNNITEIQHSLNDFHSFIEAKKTLDIDSSFKHFKNTLENTNSLFKNISSYSSTFFKNGNAEEWNDIWSVINSNMSTIQGLGESAYIKALMIDNFNKTEVDTLTNDIVKHIPQSFNLLEADKYKNEYMQAVKEIEEESNAKDNLWDRFLNVLAGNVPFKQTPEERVMMRRWLDGGKGEL